MNQWFRRFIISSLISYLIVIFASGCNKLNNIAEYDNIVKFDNDVPIKFPDFEMTYVGERKDTSIFPNGSTFTFTYNVFKLKNDIKSDSVTWTSGTGEIGPIYFEFSGSKYSIELKYWEKQKKKLDEDELVITKR